MCLALQAIKDAEADEQLADQLAALQVTLSRLAEQEAAGEAVGASAQTHAQEPSAQVSHLSQKDKSTHPTLICLCRVCCAAESFFKMCALSKLPRHVACCPAVNLVQGDTTS